MRIVTEKYTLHPNVDPTRVPIKILTKYNVSVTPEVCKENTNVTLTIKFTESVVEHAKYIICKVFRYDELMHTVYKSRVNLTIAQPTAETTMMMTIIPTTKLNIIPINSVALPMGNTMINSGSSLSVHFSYCCNLLLIIHLSFAFSILFI